MTRHEADRVHEGSGITFAFAGHLVWGNPKLAEGLNGDVEAWRCGRCNGLVVGKVDVHALSHVGRDADLDELRAQLDRIVPGAYKPIETPSVGTPQAQLVNDHAREKRIAAYREAYEQGRVMHPNTFAEVGIDSAAVWSDAATVHEVTAEQLRADGLPE